MRVETGGRMLAKSDTRASKKGVSKLNSDGEPDVIVCVPKALSELMT
jgi:hypothetical protein